LGEGPLAHDYLEYLFKLIAGVPTPSTFCLEAGVDYARTQSLIFLKKIEDY